uniref:Uncharacterized protein n=1 Tax=Globodera rostochiensis TaxID=31243 RepID=A0A914GU21_GLORO
MLSLLSLLLASGTVLKADTERWTPQNYPNPRRNHTGCNTWENSTLCDPDHILTDQWRAQINENIQKQMIRLINANVPLAEKAPAECQNRTEGVTIYVLLAKQIWIPKNQSITGNDLTNFGDELAQRYGLNELPCKTFLLLIGIEAAKLAYVRTGKDLRLPADLMQRVFHEYKLFNAKNFMAGLNKIVDEIGAQMADPFKDREHTTASSARPNATSTDSSTTSLAEIVQGLMEKNGDGDGRGETNASGRTVQMPLSTGGNRVEGEVRTTENRERGARHNNGMQMGAAQWWMFFALGTAILISFGSLALLAMTQQRQRERRQMRQNMLTSSNGIHPKLTRGRMDPLLVLAAKNERVQEEKRVEEEKQREGEEEYGEVMVEQVQVEEGREKEAREGKEEEKTPESIGEQNSFSEKPSTAESGWTATLLHWQRVRIGAADLATDVIGGGGKAA